MPTSADDSFYNQGGTHGLLHPLQKSYRDREQVKTPKNFNMGLRKLLQNAVFD